VVVGTLVPTTTGHLPVEGRGRGPGRALPHAAGPL